jgi:hypothetical protein
MADLTLIYGALDKLDCAIMAYGCVMTELDDDPERKDSREVATIKWLYEVLSDEAPCGTAGQSPWAAGGGMSARKPKATNESSSNRFFRLGQQLAASPTPEAFAWLALLLRRSAGMAGLGSGAVPVVAASSKRRRKRQASAFVLDAETLVRDIRTARARDSFQVIDGGRR